MDVGTQTVAIVGEHSALLDVFCREIARVEKRIRRIKRAMDRSRRANNMANFNPNGTFKKSSEQVPWKDSTGYKLLWKQYAKLLRREAEYRKNFHGQLVAKVLKFGDDILTEKINYQSWAKRKMEKKTGHKKKSYGRSIGRRAPGMFIARLKFEAENGE